jgi:hypothetical protein
VKDREGVMPTPKAVETLLALVERGPRKIRDCTFVPFTSLSRG